MHRSGRLRLAGYKDGLESRLGEVIWTVVLLLLAWALLRHMVRAKERERTITRRIGDRLYVLTLGIPDLDEDKPREPFLPRGFRWNLSPLAKA